MTGSERYQSITSMCERAPAVNSFHFVLLLVQRAGRAPQNPTRFWVGHRGCCCGLRRGICRLCRRSLRGLCSLLQRLLLAATALGRLAGSTLLAGAALSGRLLRRGIRSLLQRLLLAGTALGRLASSTLLAGAALWRRGGDCDRFARERGEVHGLERGKCAAVDGARTVLPDRGHVLGGRVALVLRKPVRWPLPVVLSHQPVPRHLGNDTCGPDRKHLKPQTGSNVGFVLTNQRPESMQTKQTSLWGGGEI